MPSNRSSGPASPFGFGRRVTGSLIALAITALIATLFISITGIGAESASRPPDIAHLVRMTAMQAGLSTILSLAAGVAIAWALNRLRFPGRDAIASLFATAIVAPGIVVAFGLITVWGRSGWVAALADAAGLEWTGAIFGLHGILAAHLILDGAFAARVLLTRLDTLPASRLKTAQSLGFSTWQRFHTVDWPAIAGALPGLGAIIFLLAFTSFPVVLLLGGGPANQTLEVAIYSAVRLSFDLNGAVTLALVQLAACALVIGPVLYLTPDLSLAGSGSAYHWPEKPLARTLALGVLTIGLLGFATPLLAVITAGLAPGIGAVLSDPDFWRALVTSLTIGIASASLTAVFAIGISLGRMAFAARLPRFALGIPVFAYLVVPAVVLSLGFFLAVRNLGIRPADAAPFVLVLANSLLALPFAMSVLSPAVASIEKRYARLTRSLALTGWLRWHHVEFPLLRPELALAFTLSFCFSLGDLGVISLFGTGDFSTLPWLMFRALGAYRSNDAAVIASLLLLLIFAAFWLTPLAFRKRSDA